MDNSGVEKDIAKYEWTVQETTPQPTAMFKYSCLFCQMNFETLSEAYAHYYVEMKLDLNCPRCKQDFLTWDDYAVHVTNCFKWVEIKNYDEYNRSLKWVKNVLDKMSSGFEQVNENFFDLCPLCNHFNMRRLENKLGNDAIKLNRNNIPCDEIEEKALTHIANHIEYFVFYSCDICIKYSRTPYHAKKLGLHCIDHLVTYHNKKRDDLNLLTASRYYSVNRITSIDRIFQKVYNVIQEEVKVRIQQENSEDFGIPVPIDNQDNIE